jgi:hypothetical protein
MMRHAWLLVTGCVWAAMMFFLFEREVRPYFEYQLPPSYRLALRDKTAAEVQRRSITFSDGRIGDAETLLEPQKDGGTLMKTRVIMKMGPLSPLKLPDDRVYMNSEVRVDAAYQLAEFRMECRYQGIPMSVRGQRQGEKLFVKFSVPFLPNDDRLVDLPRDAILSDNFLPYQGGGRLEEGKKWKMRFLDVGSLITVNSKQQLAFTEMYATVVGKELLKVNGRDVPAFKVDVKEQPNDEPEKWAYQIWVDDRGTVVRQLMKVNKLPCAITLDEQRTLTPDEARAHVWKVEPPR